MSDYLFYNGAFQKSNTPLITANNRGLRYGDGLFETMKFENEQILLAGWHFERLFGGLHLLSFEWPAWFTPAYLTEKVTDLCKKNQHPVARVRINIFRGDGGLYDPENHFPNCIIQSWPLPTTGFQLNENGLVAGIYNVARKTMDSFSNLKSNNYLPYSMAALHAKKNRWNDAFIINAAGRICDATIANVFIIKDSQVCTSTLQEGGIAGVMRKYLLENLPAAGFAVQEKNITVEDLLAADEVFLTNAIKGIRWVGQCESATFSNHRTKNIFEKLLAK